MNSKLLPRRAFLSLFVLPTLPVLAQTPADDSPAAKLKTARDLLVRGQHYERAAELCREAQMAAPDDWQIAATLGCALTSRAVSIASAAFAYASIPAARLQYQALLRVYQVEKKSAGFKGSPPVEPPAASEIRFKDDGQPYNLTYGPDRVATLTREATAAFEQAKAKAKTSAEKGEAAHLQGWGLRLLRDFGGGIASVFPEFPATPEGEKNRQAWRESGEALLTALPERETIVEAFKEATVADAENAAYWQSLGDAYNDVTKGIPSYGVSPRETLRATAVAAREKSLALEPKNARLWYHVFQWWAERPESAKDQVRLLRNAARYDPGNAWYGYDEAALLANEHRNTLFGGSVRTVAKQDETHKNVVPGDGISALREAVRIIEQTSGAAAKAVYPGYRPPVPRLLASAWANFSYAPDSDFACISRFCEMAGWIAGYADYQARTDKNLAEAERACNVLIDCGEKIAGSLPPVRDVFRDSLTLRIYDSSDFLVAAGYGKLTELLREVAPDRVAPVEAKYRAIKARITARQTQSLAREELSKFAYLSY